MAKKDRQNDILANTGVRIGGNDFDKDLSLKCFMPAFGYKTQQRGQDKDDKVIDLPTTPFRNMAEWSSINFMYNYKELNFAKKMLYNAVEKEKVKRFVELIENEYGYSLLNIVENTKIQLTSVKNVTVKLDFISDTPTITASQTDFEDSLIWDVERIFKQIDECIKQAQVKQCDIKLVILTGGSTEIPYIQHLVSSYFPDAEISQENKLSSVGVGLAYDSYRRF